MPRLNFPMALQHHPATFSGGLTLSLFSDDFDQLSTAIFVIQCYERLRWTNIDRTQKKPPFSLLWKRQKRRLSCGQVVECWLGVGPQLPVDVDDLVAVGYAGVVAGGARGQGLFGHFGHEVEEALALDAELLGRGHLQLFIEGR